MYTYIHTYIYVMFILTYMWCGHLHIYIHACMHTYKHTTHSQRPYSAALSSSVYPALPQADLDIQTPASFSMSWQLL